MLSWERYREDGYEAQRGLFLGEPLYHVSRGADGRWHVYFRGEAVAHNGQPRPGPHYQQIKGLKDAAEAHFAQAFLPRLLQVLRGE
jgi:hypothetical protein